MGLVFGWGLGDMATHDDWQWYSGRDGETYQFGPYANKADAVREAQDDACGEFQDDDGVWKVGVHVCEATNPPIRLADWVGADRLIERAEDDLVDSDRVGHDFDEGPFFSCTAAQENDLLSAIKVACDEWQARNGLVFTCNTFLNMRNQEYLVVDHPNTEAA